MEFNLFGWQIRKAKKEEEFTEADKLACFILMAFTDKVNKLFRKRGFQVYTHRFTMLRFRSLALHKNNLIIDDFTG